MNIEYTFASSSNEKYQELYDYLPPEKRYRVMWRDVNVDERAVYDLDKIVRDKVTQAFSSVRSRVFVDHASLEIEALRGVPGPHSNYFWRKVGAEVCSICKTLKNAKANVTVMMAYTEGSRIFVTTPHIIAGTIADAPVAGRNFSWDQVFIPDGASQTFSQLSIAEKNAVSPRSKAFSELVRLWDSE